MTEVASGRTIRDVSSLVPLERKRGPPAYRLCVIVSTETSERLREYALVHHRTLGIVVEEAVRVLLLHPNRPPLRRPRKHNGPST